MNKSCTHFVTLEEYQSYKAGYRAYRQGYQHNPYDINREKERHDAWDDGWYEANGDE